MGVCFETARCVPMTADPSIHTIDTGFQRPDFDAAYLIVENGSAGLRRLRHRPVCAGDAAGAGGCRPGCGSGGLVAAHARAPGPRRRRRTADAAAAQRKGGAASARCAAHDRPDPADCGCDGGVRRRGDRAQLPHRADSRTPRGGGRRRPPHRSRWPRTGAAARRATHCTIIACGMRAAAAGSLAIRSASPTASWTARRALSSSRLPRRCSSTRRR